MDGFTTHSLPREPPHNFFTEPSSAFHYGTVRFRFARTIESKWKRGSIRHLIVTRWIAGSLEPSGSQSSKLPYIGVLEL
jgi:hypothetical protein